MTKYTIKEIDKLPQEIEAKIHFSSREAWLNATDSVWPNSIIRLMVYQGETPLLYCPLQFIKKGPLKRAYTPLLTNYGGPFLLSQREHFHANSRQHKALLNELYLYLENNFNQIILFPYESDYRPALDLGWKESHRVVVESDLSKELPGEVLRIVRKAQKNGLSFGLEKSGEAFIDSYKHTFDRQKQNVPYAVEKMALLKSTLSELKLIENFVVSDSQGKELAFAGVINDPNSDVAELWWASSLPEAERLGAMHLLIEGLRENYKETHKWLDLGGVDYPTLAVFKEQFGHKFMTRCGLEKFQSAFVEGLMKLYTRINS